MCRHPIRVRAYTFAIGLLGFVLGSTPAVAQQPGVDISPTFQAGSGALSSLVLASGLLLLAPEYTTRTTDRIRNKPVETLVYGIGLSIAFVFLSVVVIAILRGLGALLLIPVVFVVLLVSQLGYLSIGMALTTNRPLVLLVAVVTTAFAAGVPILGGLVGLIFGSLGTGAAYLDYRDSSHSGS
jgi:uncharacterized protein YacL